MSMLLDKGSRISRSYGVLVLTYWPV